MMTDTLLFQDVKSPRPEDMDDEFFKDFKTNIENLIISYSKEGKSKSYLNTILKNEIFATNGLRLKFEDLLKKAKERKKENEKEKPEEQNSKDNEIRFDDFISGFDDSNYVINNYPNAIKSLSNYKNFVLDIRQKIDEIYTNQKKELIINDEEKNQKWKKYGVKNGLLESDGKTIRQSKLPEIVIYELNKKYPNEIHVEKHFIHTNFLQRKNDKTEPYTKSFIDKIIANINKFIKYNTSLEDLKSIVSRKQIDILWTKYR